MKEEFSKNKKKISHKEAFADSAQTEEAEVKEEGSKHKKKKSHKETIGKSAQTEQVEVSKHKKKTHKEASAESPQTEQLEVSKHKKKTQKEASAESPQTEQFVDEKGDGIKCKNENQGKPDAKEEEVSAGKQAIPGGDKVGEKDQNPNVDGASHSNYARIGILAPCSSERCVLKGPPKGCDMAAYKKLAESHT